MNKRWPSDFWGTQPRMLYRTHISKYNEHSDWSATVAGDTKLFQLLYWTKTLCH